MRSRFNGVLAIAAMLALVFSFVAVSPTGAAAQEESGSCQWSFGADENSTVDDSVQFNNFTADECESLLAENAPADGSFGQPQTSCQISVSNGNIVVQGPSCGLAPAPDPTETPVTPEPTETPVTPEPTETPVTPEPTETPVTPEPTETPVTPEPTEPDNGDDNGDDNGTDTGDKNGTDSEGGKATPGEKTGATSLPSTGSGEQAGTSSMTLMAGFVAAAAVLGTTGLFIARDRRS